MEKSVSASDLSELIEHRLLESVIGLVCVCSAVTI